MLKPYQATMLMIKYSIYGPQQSGARTPVPTTSPWQPVTDLYKAFGRCQEVAQYGLNLHPEVSVCPVPKAN